MFYGTLNKGLARILTYLMSFYLKKVLRNFEKSAVIPKIWQKIRKSLVQLEPFKIIFWLIPALNFWAHTSDSMTTMIELYNLTQKFNEFSQQFL